MSLEPGQVIDGKYRIVRRLGVGGMGAVYEGENVRIHRKVAIKVLHAQVATKADIVQRFEREAQAAGRIGSKHIVEVLDLGNLPGGERFMVMEYLDGESLGERLKRVRSLSPAELVPLMIQVLDGLAAAHDAGIVHRDLKPDNIYLLKPRSTSRPEEFVKLLDFGVSKFSSLDSDMSMTSTGAVMGTPYYLSPEQARGGKVDARSDLYAIGVVLYQCLAGHVPFQAESFNELLFKIALENPKPLGVAVPGIDPGLVAIVERGMAREPGARFQSAAEMRDALVAWAQSGVGGMIALRTTGSGPAMSPALAASLATSTAGAAAPFGGHGAMVQVSGVGGAGLGASAGPLGLSGANGPSPLALSAAGAPAFGASGAAAHAMSQSGGPLNQSGGPLNQSGSPLNQSGGAMAVTAPQPAKKPVIALIVGTLVAGCALGGGMWLAFGSKGAVAAGDAVTAAAPARPDGATDGSAAPAASAAPAPTGASPSADPSAAPDGSAAPEASAAPATSAAADAPSADATSKPRTGGTRKPPSGGAKPPAGTGAKPPPAGAGRVITPTL